MENAKCLLRVSAINVTYSSADYRTFVIILKFRPQEVKGNRKNEDQE